MGLQRSLALLSQLLPCSLVAKYLPFALFCCFLDN
ncbi:hypothetical protein Pint_31784 [Pistacia integerrima]|uniref:Uncharacterized protein n=1 Tax=Pistacia integerrima TaxID=434235 RepID=A0ACC0XR13_9ROSI|nr:hypothetical protein Pint_31784 [Pistacia integerrima]